MGKDAADFRTIRDAYDCHHFHVFGNGWDGGEKRQNHKKWIGQSAFSRFGKYRWEVGGSRQNHEKMHNTVIISIVLEVPWNNYHLHKTAIIFILCSWP